MSSELYIAYAFFYEIQVLRPSDLVGDNKDIFHAEFFCHVPYNACCLHAPLAGFNNNDKGVDRSSSAPGEVFYAGLHINDHDLIPFNNQMLKQSPQEHVFRAVAA